MELAVVSLDDGASHDAGHVAGVVARLAAGSWSRVHGASTHRSIACDIAGALAVPTEIVERLDLGQLMIDSPGQRVVAIAGGEAIRELAAAVMAVDVAPVPLPRQLSLTRIQASRSGTRTVLCLNDTLHLLTPRVEQDASIHEGNTSHG
jgi:hypothetical protein